jgi:hypothetical protein
MIPNVTMPGAADEQARAVANRCEKLNPRAYNDVKGREGGFRFVCGVGWRERKRGKHKSVHNSRASLPMFFDERFIISKIE